MTARQLDLIVAELGGLRFGLDISRVQEINRDLAIVPIPPVPGAPSEVCSVVNLRGEVVTILELRRLLGMPGTELTRRRRAIIAQCGDERIGLLVDAVGDVLHVNEDDLNVPPPGLSGPRADAVTAVWAGEDGLVALLDLDALVAVKAE